MGCQRRIRFALLLVICVVMSECAWAQLKPGIVVEEVAKHSEAEKAGLQAGDVLLSWSRGDAKGGIESPFDLSAIEIEQAPRGSVTFEGLRGAERETWVMGPDDWGIKARPDLPPDLLSIYLEGQELAKAGKLNEAVERWRAAVVEAQKSSSTWLSAWFLFHSAEQLAEAQQWKEADGAYQQAFRQASGGGPAMAGGLLRVWVLRGWAITYQRQDDWKRAESCYQQAIAESQKLGVETLLTATLLDRLSAALRIDSQLHQAEEYGHQALAIQQKLAPGNLAVARTLTTLGLIDLSAGDFTGADDLEHQALAIQERLSPQTLTVATTVFYVGVIARYRGDLAESEKYLQQALSLQQQLAPGSLELSSTLTNLGNIAEAQGDLTKTEKYYRLVLPIREKLAPGSISLAGTLLGLGTISLDRDDLAKAEEYFRQSLAIHQKLLPGGLPEASVWMALSAVAQGRGDDVAMERCLLRALAIQQKLAPNSIEAAYVLDDLGELFRSRGDLAKAEHYYSRALAVRRKEGLDSLYLDNSLSHLGDLARDRGNLKTAEEYYRQALKITERRAPGSAFHAELQAALAEVLRRQEQLSAASQLYEQALNALENQIAVLGGTAEAHSSFRANHAGYYKDYIDLLINQKQPERAFQVAERWHARTLLEMLAAARVDIHTGVDSELIEKERRLQQSFSAKSSRRIQLLSGNHTAEQLTDLDKEIKDVLQQYQDVEEQIRATSPAYAALTQPQPLSAKEVQQQLLDANTVLLEYSLGEDRSYVFAVTSTSLAAYELPRRARIESVARDLYKLVTAPDDSGKTHSRAEAKRKTGLNQALAMLSRMVLGPVATQIKGKRLLVVSDGALQYIAFAMLPDLAESGAGNAGAVPLIAGHEIVNLPSASVLAVLRQQTLGRKEAPKTAAVLADPVFDKRDERVIGKTSAGASGRKATSGPIDEITSVSASAERLSRSVADAGLLTRGAAYLPRLPFSRREAEAILAVTPDGEGMKALDFLASRETAMDPELAQYRIVHFATHGLLDSEHPELSGLVLSLVDEHGQAQNGFLDLQDIYNLNLPAELVVLSACETGLGKEINGEGLVGLTRGFMYAGARRVVASLWNTDDAASAEFMAKFYTAMEKERMPPAAALRQAQIETWKQKRWADPYYWAGFQLQGEWK